jgi:hypothetical protein
MKNSLALAQLAAIGLCATCVLFAQDESWQKVQVSKTEHATLASNGTLRFQNSTGELTVEGWDQPGVEITTIVSSKEGVSPREREKVTQELGRVQVGTKQEGDELVVTTAFPRHRLFPPATKFGSATDLDVEYQVKAPRNVRLVVDHNIGEVHVDELAGNLHVKVRQGLITVRLMGDGPRSIDAKSAWGSVTSDFAGKGPRRDGILGHQFVEDASATAQNLFLRISYGDIVLLKVHLPEIPQIQK